MKRSARWLLDSLWLVGLAFYVLAGVDKVPFHGDESTLIFMSRDYHYLVQQHNLDAVLYDPDTDHPTEQNIRMINGTTGKMAMGLAWDIAGLTVDDLNDQWAWGYTPEQNDLLGNRPSDDLLHAARLSSAVLLVISVWAVWGIARLVTRRRWAAYAASLIYVTSPAVLLNGRRAMMEGSQLGFTTLAVLVAFLLLRIQPRSRRLTAWYTVFGAACGLAVASKHNVLITLGVLFVALALEPMLRPGRARVRREHLLRLCWAGLVMIAVFVLLTPAWWSDFLGMPGRVTRARVDMLNDQIKQSESYDGFGAQAEGLIQQAFFAKPQFYEVQPQQWEPYIRKERAEYNHGLIAGRRGSPVWGALLVMCFTAGVIALVKRWRESPAWALLLWISVVALALLIATPLPWQRYYLPLQAPLAVVEGVGAVWIADFLRGRIAVYRHSPHVRVSPQSLWMNALLLMISALLLISRACDLSMWSGETRTIFHSAGTLEQILQKDRDSSWPPAYFVLLHGWMKIAGKNELAVHSINILAGLLGTACMIRAGQVLHSGRAGWLAGLAYATSGYAAYFLIEVRGYGLVLALAPALIWLHARWKRCPIWEKALPLVLVQTALLYSHYGNALILILLTGLWTVMAAPRRLWGQWPLITGISGLLFLPQWSAAWDFFQKGQVKNSAPGPEAWYRAYSAHQDILWAVIVLLALVGLVMLIRRGTRDQRSVVIGLVMWGIGIPLLAYLGRAHLPVTRTSSLAFTIPAILLLVGMGLAQLPRRASLAGAGLLLVFVAIPWQPFDHRPSYHSEPPLRDLLRDVAQRFEPGDTAVIDPELSRMVAEPSAWWYYEQIYFPGAQLLRGPGARVWYLAWRGSEDKATRQLLAEGRLALEQRTLDPFAATLYERPPLMPGILMGEVVRFRGVTLPAGTIYRPGDRLKVETWWSVDQAVERDDYSIGLYLIDSAGKLITQVDGSPTGPFTPDGIAQWEPGSMYRDDRILRLPACLPTGTYQLRTAVYGWQDGVRLLPEEGDSGDGLLQLAVVTIVSEAECE